MDIMRPKLTRIRNMCFRRLDVPNDGIIDDYNDEDFYSENKQNITDIVSNEVKNAIPETTTKLKSITALEESEMTENIEDISGGKGNRFRAQLEISKYFHKFIVGMKGNQKAEIEYQSRCRILVPNQTDLTSAIVITGNSESDVKCAVDKIKATVNRARNRSDFTHFLSIPFNEDSICERFITFKTQILKDNEINKGIDESLFQNKNKLHLTVSPLLLTDQNERTIASQILDDCHQNYIKPLINGQSLRVKLEGIDYMNDDPTQVKVIYAKVHDMSEKQCFQSIVDYLFDRFEEKGLMCRSHEVNADCKVKIHVTLMNTSFSQRQDKQERRRDRGDRGRTPTQHFDGSGILNKFKDFYFGEIVVQTIEISIRHSSLGKNGYYSHTSRIEL